MSNLTDETKMLKVFGQLYVGFREEKTRSGITTLGFATPFENNKAFEKRKKTVDHWASGPISAKIIDNEAIDGFRIADDVRRVYWGGGNVVWRVWDPRGFELEISSSNLCRIIDSVGLQPGGLIPVKCVWGRLGANNILVPQGSDLWQKTIMDAEKMEERSKTLGKDAFKPGNIIAMSSGQRRVYLGCFNIVCMKSIYVHGDGCRRCSTENMVVHILKKMHVVAEFKDDKLTYGYIYKGMKVISVDGTFDLPPSVEDWINDPEVRVEFASSVATYSDCRIVGVTNDEDARITYRQVSDPEISIDNFYQMQPKVMHRYSRPLWLFSPVGNGLSILNNAKVRVTSNRGIQFISSRIIECDDKHIRINFGVGNQPFNFNLGMCFDEVDDIFRSNLQFIKSSIVEVGFVLNGKFIPVLM